MFRPNTDIFKFLSVSFLMILLTACATTSKPVVTAAKLSENSRPDLIEIIEEYGADPDITDKFNQAIKLINEERYENAIQLLLEVTSKTQKHSAPYINLGIVYAKIGKIQEAEQSLLSALKINPAHPVTQNEMGMVYRKTGRFAEARQAYENVLKRYPQFLPARKNIGILCDIFMNDLDCAIEHYEAYLEVRPTDANVKIWLADLKKRKEK